MSLPENKESELLSRVADRLRRAAAAGDPSLVLTSEASFEAQQLASLLGDDDKSEIASLLGEDPGRPARLVLGWYHWSCFLALPEGDDDQDFELAVRFFTPCFMAGIKGLPEALAPAVADEASSRAAAWFEQALASSDERLIDLTVSVWRHIVDGTPGDDNERALRIYKLGRALHAKFRLTRNPADLDVDLVCLRLAVESTSADDPGLGGRLALLANALWAKFEQTGMSADLDVAIDVTRTAVETTSESLADHADLLDILGARLWFRWERGGTSADWEGMIDATRAAINATPVGHPDLPGRLFLLGGTLRSQVQDGIGTQAVWDGVIDAYRTGLEAAPEDHPGRIQAFFGLGSASMSRFVLTGALDDLESAVTFSRAAAAATPAADHNYIDRLSILASALYMRFEHQGISADLDESITLGRQLAQIADYPDKAEFLSSLGLALLSRFQRKGVVADLTEAIDVCRAAMDATPVNHHDWAACVFTLSTALQCRFERAGALADLEEAIDASRTMVQAVPVGDPRRPASLSVLSRSLQFRFLRTGELADADTAVEAGRAAIETGIAGDPDRPGRLYNLASTLLVRYDRSASLADLEEAIDLGREALDTIPAGHTHRSVILSGLGGALSRRFARTGALADAEAAVSAGRDALAATPADDPDLLVCLSNLATSLLARFELTSDPADREEAISACEQAAGIVTAGPSLRIAVARAASELVAGSEPGRAASLLSSAVMLLPEVTARELERGDQQFALGELAGIAGDAAALVLADPTANAEDQAARALGLLEAGRAVLLSQALETRSDTTDLRMRRPDLAQRLDELRYMLDRPPGLTDAASVNGFHVRPPRNAAEHRRIIAGELATTLAEIRTLDGFTSFGLPPTLDELIGEAQDGPVIVFNVSSYRSDALLLTRGGVERLSLPDLGYEVVISQIQEFYQALQEASDPAAGSRYRRKAQERLLAILEWLWDAGAEPVLNALGYQAGPEGEWPRAWWVPGGLLGLLPLHAAGHHAVSGEPPGRTVMDRVVSSYTPTVRSLGYARQRRGEGTAPLRGLIVEMATTPGIPDRLDYVSYEAQVVAEFVPHPVRLAEQDSPGRCEDPEYIPTHAKVLAQLPGCSIAHFACHGVTDPVDPSKSRLLLHDHIEEPFTVASLSHVDLNQAQLAYLSACNTALNLVPNLMDEAIHLTTAFQLAGFPHVIGTMWEINDQLAVEVANTFYGSLRTSEGILDIAHAAGALHSSIRAIRDKFPHVPSLWATYLHAGA